MSDPQPNFDFALEDADQHIVALAKAQLQDLLDVCLVYVGDPRATTIECEYRLTLSTIAARDHSLQHLIGQLADLRRKSQPESILRFLAPKDENALILKEGFLSHPMLRWEEQRFAWFVEEVELRTQRAFAGNKVRKKRGIKTYRFNRVGTICLIEQGQLLVFTSYVTSKSRKRLDRALPNLARNLVHSRTKHQHKNDLLGLYQSVLGVKAHPDPGLHETFRAYRDSLIQNGSVERLHLFLLDATDRRLYFRCLEPDAITDNNVTQYQTELIKLKRVNIALSEPQQNYIFKRFERWFNKAKRTDLNDSERLETLSLVKEVLGNIHDPDWIKRRLSNSSKADKRMRFVVTNVLSWIPQEPWTGVAGYTAQTRCFDISRSGEERWLPESLPNGYFYRKLMLFERLLGVGGDCFMAAVPVLDCGQVVGVIFATCPEPPGSDKQASDKQAFDKQAFDKQASDKQAFDKRADTWPPHQLPLISRMLALTKAFDRMIGQSREQEFIRRTSDGLLSETDRSQGGPASVFARHLPLILNVNLVVVWMPRRAHPISIYAYQRTAPASASGVPDLLPLEYSLLPRDAEDQKGNSLYRLFSLKQWRTIENAGEHAAYDCVFEYSTLLDSLPTGFRDWYNKHATDDVTAAGRMHDSSLEIEIESVIRIPFSTVQGTGYIVAYCAEQAAHLLKYARELTRKLGLITQQLETQIRFTQWGREKQMRTHHIREGMIQPLAAHLSRAIELCGKATKVTGIPMAALRELRSVKSFLGLSRESVVLLNEYVTRIDDKTIKNHIRPERLDLVEILANVWNSLKTVWQSWPYSYDCESFSRNGVLYLNGVELDCSFEAESGGNLPLELWHVYGDKVCLHTVFYSMIRNIYDSKVLPAWLLQSKPTRGKTEIHVKHIGGGLLGCTIKDFGLGMTEEDRGMIQHMINTVERLHREGKSGGIFKDDKPLTLDHEQRESNLGLGLTLVANALRSLQEGFNCSEWFWVESKVDEGTSFHFVLPMEEPV
jgi:signal transduction histidine kinase